MISNELKPIMKGFFYFFVICILLSGISEIIIISCVNYYKTNNLKLPSSPVYFYYRDLDKVNLPLKYILGAGFAYVLVVCIISPVLYLLKASFVPKTYFKNKDYLITMIIFSIAFFFYYFLYDINTVKLPSCDTRYQYTKKVPVTFPIWKL